MYRLLAIAFGATFLMTLIAVPSMKAPSVQMEAAPAHTSNAEIVSSSSPARMQTTAQGRWLDETVIERDATGQFHINGVINGNPARFLVDTGADLVALSVRDAEQYGVRVDRSQFQPVARTASGVGYGQRVNLPRIEVAGKQLVNVEAMVVEGLDVNLLGQSALRQLGKVQFEGDTLRIVSN